MADQSRQGAAAELAAREERKARAAKVHLAAFLNGVMVVLVVVLGLLRALSWDTWWKLASSRQGLAWYFGLTLVALFFFFRARGEFERRSFRKDLEDLKMHPVEKDATPAPEPIRNRISDRIYGLTYSMWIPATINLAAIAVLVASTGGAIESPFAAVPLTAVIIGQIMVPVEELDIPEDGFWDTSLYFLRTCFFTYRASLVVLLICYVLMIVLPEIWDFRSFSAFEATADGLNPAVQYYVVAVVMLILSMIVTLVGRAQNDNKFSALEADPDSSE